MEGNRYVVIGVRSAPAPTANYFPSLPLRPVRRLGVERLRGPTPSPYNLACEDFVRHLAGIAETRPLLVWDIDKARSEPLPFLLTFDDANLSAHGCIADLLEGYGWRGNFFVTTNYIGTARHLSKEQIRELRKRGHVVGSHSCSHPEQMSRCPWKELTDEWTGSAKTLSDILGEQVTVASLPGGHYSRRVAEAACVAGIKALFTSEPVTSCHHVDGSLVLGRYTILRGHRRQP